MELLIPDTGLFFWMVLSFGIVFIILAKFGFPIITRMVAERKTYIEKSLEAAIEANKKLESVRDEAEGILVSAQKEQVRILNEATDTRNKMIVEAREQARVEGLKELEEVKRQIQIEKEDAIRDIRRQVAELSVDVAEKVLRSNLDNKEKQQSLIERLLDETMVSKS